MAIPSRRLTDNDAAIVKALLARDWLQSDIASLMSCSSGRVSEIATGIRKADVPTADLSDPNVRARFAEIQIAWTLRICRQLAIVIKPEGSLV